MLRGKLTNLSLQPMVLTSSAQLLSTTQPTLQTLNMGSAAKSMIPTATLRLGTDGNDLISLGVQPDLYNAGRGDDTVYGGAGNDTIYGADGSDVLFGDTGRDFLYGGAQNDLLIGGADADYLDGGDGIDTADYSNGLWGISIIGGDNNVRFRGRSGDALGDALVSIETLIGTSHNDTFHLNSDLNGVTVFGRAGHDMINAGNGNDVVDGGFGNDTINGGLGNDTLLGDLDDDFITGGQGADFINGGLGIDTADYSGSQARIIITATTDYIHSYLGSSSVHWSDANGDVLRSIEALIGSRFNDVFRLGQGAARVDAGAGDDDIYGERGSDTLYGGLGRDNLFGGDGNDMLYGGDDIDFLIGGAGADLIFGGSGNDQVSYADSWTGVFVNLSAGIGLDGDAEGDRLISIERLRGSRHGDTLYGSRETVHLNGDAGNDFIFSGGGSDVLDGSSGNDVLFGGTSTLQLIGGEGADVLHGSVGTSFYGHYGNITGSTASGYIDYANHRDVYVIDGAFGPLAGTVDGTTHIGDFSSADRIILENAGDRTLLNMLWHLMEPATSTNQATYGLYNDGMLLLTVTGQFGSDFSQYVTLAAGEWA